MSIKVLVADDSITIQKVIGIIFGGEEFSLTVVDNGKAAVDKAREINPDILLIDALMPGMSGFEVAEAIRSTPSLAAKPILILTGSFEPFDEENVKKCGADDFISKPFESQQIINKVKELLALGSSRSVSPQIQPSQPVQPIPEAFPEQAQEVSAPIYDVPVPVFARQQETPQATTPTDIWGAFTPEAGPSSEVDETPADAAPLSAAAEQDVFAIITEEKDAQLVQPPAVPSTPPSHTDSQWVPVEENTFEFEEETILESPPAAFEFEEKAIPESTPAAFVEQSIPVQEVAFGDIAFEDEVVAPAAPAFSEPVPDYDAFTAPSPVFEEPPASAPVSIADATGSTVPPPLVNLTEEQLRTAITCASKEVIERIVWEVVPDLAEALIREAIRKIKEGV